MKPQLKMTLKTGEFIELECFINGLGLTVKKSEEVNECFVIVCDRCCTCYILHIKIDILPAK